MLAAVNTDFLAFFDAGVRVFLRLHSSQFRIVFLAVFHSVLVVIHIASPFKIFVNTNKIRIAVCFYTKDKENKRQFSVFEITACFFLISCRELLRVADICLLGCGGMMPLPERFLSSLLYRHNGRMILIDCGEGTQVPIKLAGWGFKSIEAILITHYHADHVAGLPGLLLTIGNSGRTEPFYLYGPAGLKRVVESLLVIAPKLPFPLVLTELPGDRKFDFTVGETQVSSCAADHWLPCLAYALEIKRAGRFDTDRAKKQGIPVRLWKTLQSGESVTVNESVYTPDMVLGSPRKGLKIGYCTDTRPVDWFAGFFQGSDLLICEGLYGDNDLKQKANEKGHMIFSQAAQLAADSGSRELFLTHFSPALKDPEAFLPETLKIFGNTVIGCNLLKKELKYE